MSKVMDVVNDIYNTTYGVVYIMRVRAAGGGGYSTGIYINRIQICSHRAENQN